MHTDINEAILRIYCEDRPGIIAEVTSFILDHGGNILDLDQHTDSDNRKFFMRVSWDLNNFGIPREEIGSTFNTMVAGTYSMNWDLSFSDKPPRIALFVSKQLHCLFDILGRWKTK